MDHNAQATAATQRLENVVVPTFSLSLVSADAHKSAGSLPVDPSESHFENILLQMHQNGVNLRYLGLVFNQISSSEPVATTPSPLVCFLRTLLMTEMVARVAKHELRQQMRLMRSSDASKFISTITGFYNSIFGRSNDSLLMWQRTIRNGIVARFPGVSLSSLKNVQFSGVSIPALFLRIQRLSMFLRPSCLFPAF